MKRKMGKIGMRLKGTARRLLGRSSTQPKPQYLYLLDSPQRTIISTPTLSIRGWLVPLGSQSVRAVRAVINGVKHDVPYGLERLDVMKARPRLDAKKTQFSGFELQTPFEDGTLKIEVDLGNGFVTLDEKKITYSPEKLFDSYYNPKLAENWAEHQVLLENKKKYFYEENRGGQYVAHPDDTKLVALYLPQYHPVKENDEVWGRGFTEWTNTTTAQARFVGHQQPILPGGLGFYDLRVEETILDQIELAKQHGIHGFCFYYYWFSGQRLLERPFDAFLAHKEWDFSFMICWANENWTKRWDGRSEDVIIAQKYLDSDPLDFIQSVEPILLDERYIRHDGKPVLVVYRGTELGDPERYIKTWRQYFMKKHGLELEVLTMLNFDPADPRPMGFDAGIEFAPLTHYRHPGFNKKKSRPPITLPEKLIDLDFNGYIADYRAFLPEEEKKGFDFPTYASVSPSWDNEARKKGRGSLTLYGSNPDLYGEWLDGTIADSQARGNDLVFVNAWNEWAEGTTLEPTAHAGYAILNRTTEVLAKHSKDAANRRQFPMYGYRRASGAKLAVILHLFYEDRWEYLREKLATLGDLEFDLYVTVTKTTEHVAAEIRKTYPKAQVTLVPNRGRDILPFLFIVNRIRHLGYEYVLKLHSKKSKHRDDGDEWFQDLITGLLPSRKGVKAIIASLEKDAAVIGPAGHYISLKTYLGSDKKRLLQYVEEAYSQQVASELLTEDRGYFAGSMFWARLDGLVKLLNFRLIPEDFEAERGQIDGTLAHTVERLITILPELGELPVYASSTAGVKRITGDDIAQDYVYARKKNDKKAR